ncbi:S-layer family protein [Emticicia sp. BO119]|uniref:beta strand repeat-containing protein n=1 Tax=Emticicia sp. BO119 TaxID=2757768 RepID=UPI0015EFE7FB|nr:3-coathanger stack domain-containing protein [Emticicia sp. BO119]MBA4852405.1 hypothetical protein [Emticicia sp. BO119]
MKKLYILLLCFVSNILFAQYKNWTGDTNTDWTEPSNWVPAGVPGVNDAVIISSVLNMPVINTEVSIKELNLSNNGSLVINGTLNVINTVASTTVALNNATSITINGKLIVSSQDIGFAFGGTATILVNSGGVLSVTTAGNNALSISEEAVLTNNGTVRLSGTSASLFLYGNDTGKEMVKNYGRMDLVGQIEKYTDGIHNYPCGRIYLNTGDLYNNGGTFVNDGLLVMPNNLNNNANSFTNNGIVRIDGSGTFTDNETRVLNSSTGSPIFNFASGNSAIVNGIFTDSLATTSAGTYTQGTNTFTASGLPTGVQTLYAQITLDACTYIAPFTYDNSIFVPPLTINNQPKDALFCSESVGSATFTISATGATTYQWQKYNSTFGYYEDLSEGGLFGGVTSNSLVISNISGLWSTEYRCKLSDGINELNSDGAKIVPLHLFGEARVTDHPTQSVSTGTIDLWVNYFKKSFEYSINGGSNWQSLTNFSGVAAGNYSVRFRMTDSLNCAFDYKENPLRVFAYEHSTEISPIPTPPGFSEFESSITPFAVNNYLHLAYLNNDGVQMVKYNGAFIPVVLPDNYIFYPVATFEYANNAYMFLANTDGISTIGKIKPDNTVEPIAVPAGYSLNEVLGVYQGVLYITCKYRGAVPAGIAKYDGTTITIAEYPEATDITGEDFIEFQGNLYMKFRRDSTPSKTQLMKYDGANFTLIENPTADLNGGVIGNFIVYKNKLCLRYETVGVTSLAQFDGAVFTMINNSGYRYVGSQIIYDNNLYLRYENSVDARGVLVKFDGANLTIIPNPTSPVNMYWGGIKITFNNKLMLIYRYVSRDAIGYLAEFDGTSLQVLTIPSDFLVYTGNPAMFIFNNKLYFNAVKYDNGSFRNSKWRLGMYDGSSVQLIKNPDGYDAIGVGGVVRSKFGLARYDGKLFFGHRSDNGLDELAVLNNVCEAPVITNVAVTESTCSTGGIITITATGTGNYEYSIDNTSWQDSPTFSNLSAGNYTIRVRYKANPTCLATYSGNPVIVNPPALPNPTGVSANRLIICSGGSVSLSATCATGTITWYNQITGGVSIGTGSPLTQNPTITTTYYASCKNPGCESSRVATIAVTVDRIATATETMTWTGVVSKDWSNACNWSPTGVPTATNPVIINSHVRDTVIVSGTARAKSIFIETTLGTDFIINSGAELTIVSTNEDAFDIFGASTLTNYGTLNVSNLNGDHNLFRAINVLVNATLNNYGTISLTSPDNMALNVDGIFNNKSGGTLNVNAYNGIRILGTLNNESGATISGFGNVYSIQMLGGQLNNYGLISMMGQVEVYNSVTRLNNYACATFKTTKDFYNNTSSVITNSGYMEIGLDLHVTGTFNNNGVLKYRSLINGATFNNNTNSSIIVNNTTTLIFTYGGTFNGTVNGIFTDANAITSAGTFIAPNTFTPNGNVGIGSQTLYAKITPNPGGCAFIIPFTYLNCSGATISYSGTPFCNSTSAVDVTLTGRPGGVFTSSPAGLAINSSTGQITPGSGSAGTYSVIYRVAAGSGCTSASATTSVTITNNPAANISYSGTPYCQSTGASNVTLTGTSGGIFSSAPVGLIINASSGQITPGSSAAGTYTVTYSMAASGGCASATATTRVTITTNPGATISYTGTPYCKSAGPSNVTVTGSSGGTFSSAPSGLILNGSTGQITPGSSNAGIYTVTYTIAASEGCASVTATTSVTITNTPGASISYTGTPFCRSITAVNVNLTGTTGGTFSSTPFGLAINSSSGRITPSSSTAGTYMVTYTLAAHGGCASATATTNVTISNTLSAGISYAGNPYCQSAGVANVTRTGSSGGTFTSAPSGLTINALSGQITPGSSSVGTYTVTYTIAATDGCSSATATVNVTITNNPDATISYAGTPYCQSVGVANVTRSGSSGGTFTSAPVGLTLNSSSGQITTSSSTAGTYTVTYTIAANGGCASATATTSITISNSPSATISYAGTPYCKSAGTSNVTLTGSSGGIFSSAPSGLTINASSGQITPNTSTAGIYTVTYTIAANGGCASATATTNVTITNNPTASIFGSDNLTCTTTSVIRTASGGDTYQWSNGLGTTASVNITSPGIYTVTVTGSGGCTATATTLVTATNSLTATASNTGPYTIGQTIQLNAAGGGSYRWSGPNNFASNIANSTIANALAVNAGIYTVTVTHNGCTATATTQVIINGTDSCTQIVDLHYVKAGNPYQYLFSLQDGMTIQYSPDLVSIMAVPICQSIPIGSVDLTITGPNLNWTILQNVEPFAVFDNLGSSFKGRELVAGTYNFTVTGYLEDNRTGGTVYGPVVTTFTVVGNIATISAPTLSNANLCAGGDVEVNFSTTGSFASGNEFEVQLSDLNGSFVNPITIGRSPTAGNIICQIPQNMAGGSGYLIRVVSTNQVLAGNPLNTVLTIIPSVKSFMTDIIGGIITEKVSQKITATHKIISAANVSYRAGKAIELNPGFVVEIGAVFKAEIEGCGN